MDSCVAKPLILLKLLFYNLTYEGFENKLYLTIMFYKVVNYSLNYCSSSSIEIVLRACQILQLRFIQL